MPISVYPQRQTISAEDTNKNIDGVDRNGKSQLRVSDEELRDLISQMVDNTEKMKYFLNMIAEAI